MGNNNKFTNTKKKINICSVQMKKGRQTIKINREIKHDLKQYET
jgi:hypothetical protein